MTDPFADLHRESSFEAIEFWLADHADLLWRNARDTPVPAGFRLEPVFSEIRANEYGWLCFVTFAFYEFVTDAVDLFKGTGIEVESKSNCIVADERTLARCAQLGLRTHEVRARMSNETFTNLAIYDRLADPDRYY